MTEDVTYRRQEAIDTLLRLMGCTDAKGSNCEHVSATQALASAITESTFLLIDEACGGALTDFGLKPSVELQFRPGVSGHREGRVR